MLNSGLTFQTTKNRLPVGMREVCIPPLSYLDNRSNKYIRSVCRFQNIAYIKMLIGVRSIHSTRCYLKLGLDFCYQEVYVVYQSEILGKRKSKIRPHERSLDFSRIRLSPEHIMN